MKKISGVFLALLLAFSVVGAVSVTAKADTVTDECDAVFTATLSDILSGEGYGDAVVSSQKLRIYDIDEVSLGYLYDFNINGERGFAIVVYNGGIFELTELYLAGINPYQDFVGTPVYVSYMTYWVLDEDGVFTDTETGRELPADYVATFNEKAYRGYTDYESYNENILFTYKSEDTDTITNHHPQLIAYNSITCVPIAAANILAYYDRNLTELFPGIEPGSMFGPFYDFDTGTTKFERYLLELEALMHYGSGATIATFKAGLNSYVTNKGYSVSLYSLMSGGNLNTTSLKSYIGAQVPCIVFCDGFNINDIIWANNETALTYLSYSTAHAMAVFGYRDVTYTLKSGGTRSDRYLQIASGLARVQRGYCNLNKYLTIDDAYAVKVK